MKAIASKFRDDIKRHNKESGLAKEASDKYLNIIERSIAPDVTFIENYRKIIAEAKAATNLVFSLTV